MTIHHSAVALPDNREIIARLQQHQRFHQDDKGWVDIAYHVAVDRDGNIFELRDTAIAGDTATLTVTRVVDTRALDAPLVVTLTSDDADLLSVPATVTIPAGATFATVPVTGVSGFEAPIFLGGRQ